jgi:hypothetical protein
MTTGFRQLHAEVAKVDSERRLVFGYAIVCKIDGEDYFDAQGDHITEEAMLDAALDFALHSRLANEMHVKGDESGCVPMLFPMTTEVAKLLDIEVKKTGLIIVMRPDEEMFAKFESGELKGFSIEGPWCRREKVAS